MTNLQTIIALEDIKTYAAANVLKEIDYAIAVLRKLEDSGIKKPLETTIVAMKKEDK